MGLDDPGLSDEVPALAGVVMEAASSFLEQVQGADGVCVRRVLPLDELDAGRNGGLYSPKRRWVELASGQGAHVMVHELCHAWDAQVGHVGAEFPWPQDLPALTAYGDAGERVLREESFAYHCELGPSVVTQLRRAAAACGEPTWAEAADTLRDRVFVDVEPFRAKTLLSAQYRRTWPLPPRSVLRGAVQLGDDAVEIRLGAADGFAPRTTETLLVSMETGEMVPYPPAPMPRAALLDFDDAAESEGLAVRHAPLPLRQRFHEVDGHLLGGACSDSATALFATPDGVWVVGSEDGQVWWRRYVLP